LSDPDTATEVAPPDTPCELVPEKVVEPPRVPLGVNEVLSPPSEREAETETETEGVTVTETVTEGVTETVTEGVTVLVFVTEGEGVVPQAAGVRLNPRQPANVANALFIK